MHEAGNADKWLEKDGNKLLQQSVAQTKFQPYLSHHGFRDKVWETIHVGGLR